MIAASFGRLSFQEMSALLALSRSSNNNTGLAVKMLLLNYDCAMLTMTTWQRVEGKGFKGNCERRIGGAEDR